MKNVSSSNCNAWTAVIFHDASSDVSNQNGSEDQALTSVQAHINSHLESFYIESLDFYVDSTQLVSSGKRFFPLNLNACIFTVGSGENTQMVTLLRDVPFEERLRTLVEDIFVPEAAK
ncbi:hypothetical protein TNCV_3201411 [Trichonephila clavipes]|nr:hypothetical protein TNCV_3201411 [Trichonephila clavipes]